MPSQYSVIYWQDPMTLERLNLGVVVWECVWIEPPSRIEPAKPEKMLFYFSRNWSRYEAVFGHSDVTKALVERMELEWKLADVLDAIKQPIADFQSLCFSPMCASVEPAAITLGIVARTLLR
jgi:hypothetical protein